MTNMYIYLYHVGTPMKPYRSDHDFQATFQNSDSVRKAQIYPTGSLHSSSEALSDPHQLKGTRTFQPKFPEPPIGMVFGIV